MSNSVPEGWHETTIGKITSTNSLFSDGDWVESKDQDPRGNNRLIQLADIGDGVFINKSSRFMNDEQFERLNCTNLEKGDILIARMPEPLGRACLYPLNNKKAATVVDVAVIRTSNANHYWLMSAINSSEFRYFIELDASGTTRTRIARGALSKIKLLAPPLPEQKKIAAILTSVDAVIEKTQAQIDKLKDLKTGMMQELLTKGIGHTEFKDSPVGRIPVEWEVAEIGEVAEQVKPGPFGSSLTKSMYVKSGFKVYGQEQVISGDLSVGNYYINQEKYDELSAFKVQAGEILISLVGTFGQVAIVPEQFKPGVINPRLLKLRFPKNSIIPDFIAYQLRSEFVLNQLKQFQQGGTMGVLSATTVKPVKLIIPPVNAQIQIANAISSIDEMIDVNKHKLASIKYAKKSLMQDLLIGKVRVKV